MARPAKVCAAPTCGTILYHGEARCVAHHPHGRATRSPTTQAQNTHYQRARRLLLADDPPCHWCGKPATTADHEPPIAHGGDHNHMVPACAPCNHSRGGQQRAGA